MGERNLDERRRNYRLNYEKEKNSGKGDGKL
jgi:hypothetical protein